MPPGKKITKFKAKKGTPPPKASNPATLGGGAGSVKKQVKSSSTAHALPSQSEVLQAKAQQVAAPIPHPVPPASVNAVPFSPPPIQQLVKPTQSQTMKSPPPPVPGAYPKAAPVGAKTGAAPIYQPPPPGVMKGRTVHGGHPAGVMKTNTQTPDSKMSTDQQIDIKVEELTDQVSNALEIADCLMDQNWTPEKIVDNVHLLVRSLNLDAVTMVLPSMNYPEQLDNILSRGYDVSPRKAVVNLWLSCFDDKVGMDWKNLMKLAEDTKSELAYWIVHEGLYSIGYVPIRDGFRIYGFLFVAAKEKKPQSPLTASLLDLCGSRIGLSYALKYLQGNK